MEDNRMMKIGRDSLSPFESIYDGLQFEDYGHTYTLKGGPYGLTAFDENWDAHPVVINCDHLSFQIFANNRHRNHQIFDKEDSK
jgi:hypothetical protein